MRHHAPLVSLALIAASCSTPAPSDTTQDTRRPAPSPIAFEQPSRAAHVAVPRPAGIPFGDARDGGELEPFFPGSTHDPRVPHPDALLRQPLGTFTARHDEVLAGLRAIAAASERARIATFGRTHEGRELVQMVIATPENLARLDAIRANIAKLADPRGVDAAELDAIVRDTPAIAWLAYSIHGDETSGTDASLAVAHHLAAGTGADVREILANVVVVIDPCQNPDGRERILAMFESGSGYVPDLDADSMRRGRWPYGRGNHYLFDMNRDWIWGTQPETRARWSAIRAWHPQLLVDAHEMGAYDTYLFYPATDPFTPHFPQYTRTWWQRYAADQSAAFDRHGWSYYTREWADSWYVGYTDSWATFQGACGILYEQARYGGGAIRRASGEVATYRDAVRRQAVGSIANVTTLAQKREAALRDSLAAKLENVSADAPGNDRAFVLVPGREASRERELVENLLGQGIEVFRARAPFRVADAHGVLGPVEEREIPAGALVVPARQPLAPLVKAMLAFDPRFDPAALERERREVERKGASRIYDVTAWSPAHAFDVDALWCAAPSVETERFTGFDSAPPAGIVDATAGAPVYGWIVDGSADASVAFAARALEAGLAVNAADEPFRAGGRPFPRGSLLVRRVENGPDVRAIVERAARAAGCQAFAVTTARSADDGPDLGGQHFDLLERPRVALLSNAPVASDSFGHAWHALDVGYGVPVSLVDAQSFGDYDLRRYNVLVVPEGGASVVREHAADVLTWVRSGGSLVVLGSAAHELAEPELGFTDARRREDVLDDLAAYRRAVERERAAGRTKVDPADLWDARVPPPPEAPKDAGPAREDPKGDEARERDRHAALYSPQGVFLRGEVNTDAWITFGAGEEMPVHFDGHGVLLAKPGTRTAVRLASEERLRMSGLLWPESRARIADSAWLTVDRRGAGQVVLFAGTPIFRGWHRASARLFANAVVYGPGLGANAPVPR